MLSTETANPGHAPERVLFDEDGFMVDHRLWSELTARVIAEAEGVEQLTERHWRVLHHIRGKFLAIQALPNMRLVCRAIAMPREEIYALFGSCLSIWRIAGLPNPGEEAKAYMA